MRLRAVHLRGHPSLGDLSVEFRTEDRVDEGCWLVGGCGSGKTLVTDIAAMAWGSAALNRELPYAVRDCRVRVDFEINGEIAVCQSEGDRFGVSPLLRGKIDKEAGKHMLMRYGQERLNSNVFFGVPGESAGVGACYPILADLSNGNVSDSVILIDDFDLALDSQDQKVLWSHLWKHHRSQGNQLIVTARRSLGLCREIQLWTRQNPVELALKSLAQKKES